MSRAAACFLLLPALVWAAAKVEFPQTTSFSLALRVDKTEGLRFKQGRTTSSTMHLTIANQTSDQWLALPDETGYLLSSSSTFSTLNTLGVLTGLEVGGTCTNPAGVVVDAGKEACDL